MESLYNNLGAVLGISVITLLVQTFFGDETAQNMLLVILFSMLLVNSNKMVQFAQKVSG